MDVREADVREADVREILARGEDGFLDRGSASYPLCSLTAGERTAPEWSAACAESRPAGAGGSSVAPAAPRTGEPGDSDSDSGAVAGTAVRHPHAPGLAAFRENPREDRDTSTDVSPARPGEPLPAAGRHGRTGRVTARRVPEVPEVPEGRAVPEAGEDRRASASELPSPVFPRRPLWLDGRVPREGEG
ncbi:MULTISPECIES: hypothetical protein [Streptomyces]|uniref:hypothetical protein n=1 Tax=Streptomyces sp. H-KF8 TaxID=1727216 RepID=UPI0007EC668D|nr:hypothetical protein [Streptomyces sp. H-KF8]OBQ51810.1 hypothetical protein A4U61_08240 [Streptomyces sp. H-KF8]